VGAKKERGRGRIEGGLPRRGFLGGKSPREDARESGLGQKKKEKKKKKKKKKENRRGGAISHDGAPKPGKRGEKETIMEGENPQKKVGNKLQKWGKTDWQPTGKERRGNQSTSCLEKAGSRFVKKKKRGREKGSPKRKKVNSGLETGERWGRRTPALQKT